MKRRISVFSGIFILLALGCAPVFQGQSGSPLPVEETPGSSAALPVEMLDQKIRSHRERLEQESLSESDKEMHAYFVDAYTSLRAASAGYSSETQYRRFLFSLYRNVSNLDERLFDQIQEESSESSKGMPSSLQERYSSSEKEKILSDESSLGMISASTQESKGEMAGHFLVKFDRLVEEERFDEARHLLTTKERQTRSSAEMETIDQAFARLEAAEEAYIEERISMISTQEDRVSDARELMEQERYEDALSTLESLSSPNHPDSHEVKDLRDQAVEKLINRERNRAARLFLAAKNTDDLQKKKEYLQSSYGILKSLLEKYPLSGYASKIKSHMKAVDSELKKLNMDFS